MVFFIILQNLFESYKKNLFETVVRITDLNKIAQPT